MTLKIKPGKYRTFEGDVVTIEYVLDRVAHGKTFTGQPVSFALLAHGVSAGNLIERIEDEPKAEEQSKITGAVECSISTGMQIRGRASSFPADDFHVSYGAREAIRAHDSSMYEHQMSSVVKWCAARNLKLGTMGEWDGPPIISEMEAALNAKIARLEAENESLSRQLLMLANLEAENESLSRQLRSRELNKEPATDGKVWRWSPMV